MSITLVLYEVISYTLPGIIYLYVINQALRYLEKPYIALENVSTLPHILLLSAFAFILGHIFDSISIWVWYRIVYRKEKHPQQALDELQQRNNIHLRFAPEDWNILLGFIRSRNHDLAQYIEKLALDSIFLRNVSTSLLLLGLLQIAVVVRSWFSIYELLFVMGVFILSYIAIRRSLVFRRRYYKVIFEQGYVYGSSLAQVLGRSDGLNPVEKSSLKQLSGEDETLIE
jgi:hypothetical protein